MVVTAAPAGQLRRGRVMAAAAVKQTHRQGLAGAGSAHLAEWPNRRISQQKPPLLSGATLALIAIRMLARAGIGAAAAAAASLAQWAGMAE